MGIAGETAWRVPSLPMPDVPDAQTFTAQVSGEDAAGALARFTQHGAVRLFVDRAVAALPSF